jgi:nucleoside-diphosphate-sugar epimerase
MKFLLTGAGGFLGRELYDQMINRGHNIVPVVRKSLGLPAEIVFDFAKEDIQSLERAIGSCDGIIHLAAMIDFRQGFNSELFEVNFVSTLKLSRIAATYDKHFIFASSVSISKAVDGVIDQNSPDIPENSYTLSKYLAERAIESLDFNSCIIRIGGIFGGDGPEHLYLNKAIKSAISEGITPTVVGAGQSRRNYIYVLDLANWITYIAENKQTGNLIIAGTDVLDTKAILTLISELYLEGQEILVREHTEEPSDFIINGNKAPFPMRTYREALLDILQRTNI